MNKSNDRMKIQTGLRLTNEMYEQIMEMAGNSGVSLNSQILMLIEIGMKTLNHAINDSGGKCLSCKCESGCKTEFR